MGNITHSSSSFVFVLNSRQADELKLKLTQWDFSPFEFNRDELIHCVYLIFEMALSEPDLSHLTVTQGK